MKVCPNCQTPYADETLKFCLECGTPLSATVASTQPKSGGNGIIVAAILGGFALLALVVGGLGVYIFSRPSEKTSLEPINSQNKQSNLTERVPISSNQMPSVELINNNRRSDSANSGHSNSLPNGLVNDSSNGHSSASPRVVVSASSVRKPDAGNFYFPSLAFDNNPATAWCEGARGAGIGEWLQFGFDREITLTAIKIEPGYFKTDETWRKNNRVAGVSVEFSDGSTREFTLADERRTQTLDVGRVRTNLVRITIKDFFNGASDSEDTLISEVSFVTEP